MWQVVGQDRAVSFLQRSLEKEKLAHAYLFVGPPHVGKMMLALNLAQALNCETREPPCGNCNSCQKIAAANHADVQIIGLSQNGEPGEAKQRTEISIDQIRQMQHSASLPPFEGNYKVFIIEDAEFLSTEAANCLLKTLEEPTGRVIFIALTANDGLLLPTVVSRCQRLELPPMLLTQEETALVDRWNVEPEKAKLLARLSHGCLGWAITAAQDSSLLQQRDKEMERLLDITKASNEGRFAHAAQMAAQFSQNRGEVYQVLDLWQDFWRDLILVKIGCSDIIINVDRLAALVEVARGYTLEQIEAFIKSIQYTAERLMQNANPQLALEVLMLDMPGKERGGAGSRAAQYG